MPVLAAQFSVLRTEKRMRSPLIQGSVGEKVDRITFQDLVLTGGQSHSVVIVKKGYLFVPVDATNIVLDFTKSATTITNIPAAGLMVLPPGITVAIRNTSTPTVDNTYAVAMSLAHG